ncbi:MAG: hypothetical protein CME36_00585 [unclassified Hahellaceae]|nr:hypothetical protein [Hahellaceae bacterium]|tara:strand:- start:2195 stop:2821 length:627 start_codon:yes stop_codon:yes gene_type:complete
MTWLILAAGMARRFGAAKLLAPVKLNTPAEGKAREVPLIEATIASFCATAWPVAIVIREDDIALQRALFGLDVQVLSVTSNGIGDSIAAGLQTLLSHSEAPIETVGIALADMPLLSSDLLSQLIEYAGPGAVVRPVHKASGKAGHPVVFGNSFFPQLMQCSGDSGAQAVVASAGSRLRLLPTSCEGCIVDVDTPADLQRAQGLLNLQR